MRSYAGRSEMVAVADGWKQRQRVVMHGGELERRKNEDVGYTVPVRSKMEPAAIGLSERWSVRRLGKK